MQAWQATVQTEQGNVVFNPSVTVYLEDGVTLASIFNEDGSPKENPFIGSLEGFVQFWANPGVYKVLGANGADLTELWEVSLTDYDRYGSYADFIGSYIPGRVITASAVVSGTKISWARDPDGPIGPTADGGMWSPADDWICPKHWGAVGDGVTDDTEPFNEALQFIREARDAATEQRPVTITGARGTYLIAGSLNATGIEAGRGWTFRDVFIRATGNDKTVLDLIGSRFLNLDNVHIRAMGQFDVNSRPWCGILFAHSSATPFAHVSMINVTVDGYFKGAAFQNYAGEEVNAVKCLFWNRAVSSGGALPTDPDYAPAYAAIFDGRGRLPVKSDYGTPATGRQSFTVNNYVGCAFQKPNGIAGPTVYMSDMASANFEKAYITNGGSVAIDWVLFGDYDPYAITFDGLQVETNGNQSVFNFLPQSSGNKVIRGLDISFGNIFSAADVFRVGNNTGVVDIRDYNIRVRRWNGSPPVNGLVRNRERFAFSGGRITVPEAASFGSVGDYNSVVGTEVFSFNDNLTWVYGRPRFASGAIILNGLQLGSLPIYADNAAALAGGLTLSDVYKTASGALRIVI